MRITVDYGRTGLDVVVPDGNLRAVLGLQPLPALEHPDQAIRQALDAPIESASLRDQARGRRSATILICDITRPVPNERLLRPILSDLHEAGIPDEEICILIATGLHRASTPPEIVELVGSEIAGRCRVVSHDARDLKAHTLLGETRARAPVWIDRRYLDADLKMTLGLIEPHLMAGFSGGRKLICPGIAASETIRHFHGVAILESPLATAGQVEGNPVHEMSQDVARMAGCDFIVNVAIDESRRITGVFAGHPEAAWGRGVAHVQQTARAPVARPFDIVVTSAAGYPLDSSFYQAVKGLVGALPAVKPGGTLILTASLKEGLGSDEFAGLLRRHANPQSLREELHQPDYFSIDQWQVQELARVCEKARVHVFSRELAPGALVGTMVVRAAAAETAIAEALARYGPDASVAVIPRGPYVIPYVIPTVA